MVRFDYIFVFGIGFDCLYRGILLFWNLQKNYSYDLRRCLYQTYSHFLFVLMSLLVQMFDSLFVNILE